MPMTVAMPASRSELPIASLRFGQTGRLPLMLFGQSPVRNPPNHVKYPRTYPPKPSYSPFASMYSCTSSSVARVFERRKLATGSVPMRIAT